MEIQAVMRNRNHRDKRGTGVRCGGCVKWLVVCLLLFAPAVSGQSLSAIPGTPFEFSSPSAGVVADVVLLSPDEKHLFVLNRGSSSVTVLAVARDGSLTLVGKFPST